MNRAAETYATINIADLDKIDFSQIEERSEDTIRKSLDGTQFIIKYNSEPSFISDGSVVALQLMTHLEAFTLMSATQWSSPDPDVF